MSYRFVLKKGISVQVPMQYQTRNADGTKTPINLTGKTLVLRFTARGAASPMLILASDVAANAFGSKLEITVVAEGRFTVTIPVLQVTDLSPCYGRAVLTLTDATGTRELADLPFTVK